MSEWDCETHGCRIVDGYCLYCTTSADGTHCKPPQRCAKTPWVIVDGDDAGQVGLCTRCGNRLTLKLPMNLTAVCMYLDAFTEEHRYCKEPQV